MKEETVNALNEAIEGLLTFIAATKPTDEQRSKALRGLVALRDQLSDEIS